MIKLIYFDFNFWRIDILRLSLSYSKIPYDYKRIKRQEWPQEKKKFPFGGKNADTNVKLPLLNNFLY